MEKLIELLNEHGKYNWYLDKNGEICIRRADNYEIRDYIDLYIVSKKFGFIKRLVENDKIDLGLYKEYMPNLGEDFSVESNIIMNLSIAIDPIGYLNYILK